MQFNICLLRIGGLMLFSPYPSHNHTQNPVILRSKVVALLSEVPGSKLQLFKFREMFEKRYHASIGVSDLYKMKECVIITEEQSGRMVQLSGAPYGALSAGASYNQVCKC